MLMQLAVQKGKVVHQIDVRMAYLNALIDCELYIEQPEGYEQKVLNGENLVCRLKKSLYGLKQSGQNCNILFVTWLFNTKRVCTIPS